MARAWAERGDHGIGRSGRTPRAEGSPDQFLVWAAVAERMSVERWRLDACDLEAGDPGRDLRRPLGGARRRRNRRGQRQQNAKQRARRHQAKTLAPMRLSMSTPRTSVSNSGAIARTWPSKRSQ